MRIEIQYIKKMLYITFFLQFCFFVVFGTLQAPSIISMIKGINIGFVNVIFIILLSLIEYSNFIILFSLVVSMFWVLYSDFILNDMKVMFLQIGLNSNKLLYCCIVNNLLFCGVFFINNLFLTPYTNFILRSSLLNAFKNKIVYMIEPCNVLKLNFIKKIDQVDIMFSERKDDTLFGCLINNESSNLMMMLKKFKMKNRGIIDIKINDCKIISDSFIKCDVDFGDCNIKVNSDFVVIKQKKDFLSNLNIKEIVFIIKLILVTVLLAFVGFIVILGDNVLYKFFSLIFFFIVLSDSVNLIHISYITLIFLYLILLYIFYIIKQCLNF